MREAHEMPSGGEELPFDRGVTIQQVAALGNANCLPPHGMMGWWPGDSVTNDIMGRWPATLRGRGQLWTGVGARGVHVEWQRPVCGRAC